MTSAAKGRKLCWLVPDDRGGGVVSVALSCCRQALVAGQDPTLLLMLSPTGHIAEHVNFRLASLNVVAPGFDAPERMVQWLNQNPQDVVFLNGCEQADGMIPFVPAGIRTVYVVHDTARCYWQAAVVHERELDAIVAVSRSVAAAFRSRLKAPEALRVVHNGTLFPDDIEPSDVRPPDIVFLGGGSAIKGAFDVLKLWPVLVKRGFAGRLHWFGAVSAALAESVVRLPRSDAIVLHGRVQRSVIFRQAASARALLMLSRVEPFGMATIECMGMGCLPIAWDLKTGTKEIVGQDHPFFAPLGDYGRLAELVLDACEAHSWLWKGAMNRARHEFDEIAMWQRYAAFIDELMVASPVKRAQAGMRPPHYKPRTRLFQLLPEDLRTAIRGVVGRSSRLSYWLRDFRGI